MVFYGYNRDTPGYRVEKKDELADRLSDMIQAYGGTADQMRGVMQMSFLQGRPYVEVDGIMGPGSVVIRKITNLTELAAAQLVKDADAIYKQVMELD